MAGTDKTKDMTSGGPAIILVDPQLGSNIGMTARAMLNCGLAELRLVRPRDGWPSEYAEAAAAGATVVLEGTKLFDTTADAVADLKRVYAATTRPRDMTKTVVTPRQAVAELTALPPGCSAGILFGPERSGLINDDIALADTVMTVPLNPAFASLNLSQAVLLFGYEWFLASDETPARQVVMPTSEPAAKEVLINFFERLESALDETGFLVPIEKRPAMVRNIRNMFQRVGLSDQEVRTLHGIVSALLGRKKKP